MSAVLTDRENIRQWAEAHGGNPMLEDLPDGSRTQTLLQISFGQHALNADGNEGPDRLTSFELVSWDDWFAELENQGLAIRVQDEEAGGSNSFEFVPRVASSRPPGAGLVNPDLGKRH